MTYYLRSILLLLCLLLLLLGCGDRRSLRKNLYSFTETAVSLPEKAFLVIDGKVSIAEVEKERPALVSFYGYKDCYECEIAHLNAKYSLFTLADSLQQSFHSLIVFAPEAGEIEHTLHNLQDEHYPFPVYVTMDDDWTSTCGIPTDRRFHTFLLNESNHPVFVGDPTATPALMNLFVKRLKSIL